MRELTQEPEIIGFLSREMFNGNLPTVPIYADDNIWMLSERFRENGIDVLSEPCSGLPKMRNAFKQQKVFAHSDKRRERSNTTDFKDARLDGTRDLSEVQRMRQNK